MSDAPELRGPRVLLRRVTAADAPARLAIGRQGEVHRMYGGSRADLAPMTAADAEAWCRWAERHPCCWGIVSGRLLGSIRLDRIDSRDRRASLAVGIDDAGRHGQGLGSEAIRLVLSHAFGAMGLHRIGLRVLAYNARAVRAYERCGFRLEGREREAALVDGEWHDDLIMGILAHEHAGFPAPAIGQESL